MAPVRLVTPAQLEILVDFVENRQGVKTTLGPEDTRTAQKAWIEIANNLNSVKGGVQKTADSWKKYWHLLKCRTKSKAAEIRRRRARKTDGESKIIPLTEVEHRIMRTTGLTGYQTHPVLLKVESEGPANTPCNEIRHVSEAGAIKAETLSSSDDDVEVLPKWISQMENRRISSEERLTEAVVALSTTNSSILETLKEMTQTHAKILGLLDKYLNSSE